MKRFGFSLITQISAIYFATAAVLQAAAPRVIDVTPPQGSRVSLLTEITVAFDQQVSGVDARDLLVNGRAAEAANGSGSVFVFLFRQPTAGPVEIRFAPDSAITSAASVNDLFDVQTPLWTYSLHDVAPPRIVLINPPQESTVRSLTQVEITFDEPVIGLKASDLIVAGKGASSVSGASAGPYVFRLADPATGTAQVSWSPSHVITDLATDGNRFFGNERWSYLVNPTFIQPDVVISEILAANASGLRDENGTIQDWIELHNRGSQPVKLLGWSLTDEPNDPGRWAFPDVSISPGEYLVVFASGLDRRPTGSGAKLHTNFKLSRAGEYLGLFAPESPRRVASEFSPKYPPQRSNYSYGKDSRQEPRYFASPTPGGANGSSSMQGIVDSPHFSVKRGFFSNPFNLSLSSTTPRATIRYTTDGSEPTDTHGEIYSDPLFVKQTTMVRAAAFKGNTLPSEVVTHSYFFNQSLVDKSLKPFLPGVIKSLPVLSIVTASNNLYGAAGIMEFKPRNTLNRGVAWERPVSVELILPEDNGGFQVDAGFRVHGGDVVRELYNYNAGPPNGKYAFGLYFRGDYGAKALNYPMFETTLHDEFDGIILRAGFNDPLNPFIDDELVRRLMLDMGHVAVHGTTMNLFLNGVYQGYYNPVERISGEFAQRWHGGGLDWDIIEELERVREGTIDEWAAFRTFMKKSGNFSLPAHYQEAIRRMDVTNFADYLLLNIYVGMGDWPNNNWRAARERVPGAKWRFYNWDSEWSFGYKRNPVTHNTLTNELANTAFAPVGDIYRALVKSPEFRLLFADRIQKHFYGNGALTETNVLNRYEELRLRMSKVIPAIDPIIPKTWVPQRKGIIFGHLATAGLLAQVSAPLFDKPGGNVPPGTQVTISSSGGQIYYTTDGDDPRVPFTEIPSPAAKPLTSGQGIPLNSSTTLRARVLANGNWSALAEASFQVAEIGIPLRITEIMYHPPGGEGFEFVELQNVGAAPVDASGFMVVGTGYRIPDGTIISPGERYLIASGTNPAGFQARYPDAEVHGYFGGSLSNSGERVSIEDRVGRIITAVDYHDSDGWPLDADGQGASLEVIDPGGDPNDPANWRGSLNPGGSPGAAPAITLPPGVRLNEVMSASTPPSGKVGWIELKNESSTPARLDGWSLSNDGLLRKFVFPAGTMIQPGAFLVVSCDSVTTTSGGFHSGFVLTNQIERIFLYNASTQRVDAVTLGRQLPNLTAGKIDGEWTLTSPTEGGANSRALIAPISDLLINEWLANAPAGGDDWIELYNRNQNFPVSVRRLWIAANGASHQINAISFIPPLGHIQFHADENDGIHHLNFKLPAAGTTIQLIAPSGALLDQIQFQAQAEGISEGRLPDGSSKFVSFPGSASPSAQNYAINYAGPVLNEIMARNQSSLQDAQGRYIDWVELFNASTVPFDLASMSVSVGQPGSGAWKFPAGAIIPANGYLILWFDPNRPGSVGMENDLNTGFRLDGDGGEIFLLGPNDQIADRVAFGFQLPNQTIGQFGSDWRLLAQPTPGAANAGPATLGQGAELRVNEWLAVPLQGSGSIEIYNPESLPVLLTGFFVSDDPSEIGTRKHQIGPLSFIGAKGWVRFVADGHPSQGSNHLNFSLDPQGETLRIYGPAEQSVDSIDYLVQNAGVSQGRFPDGVDAIVAFPDSVSLAESNYQPLSSVVINEVLPGAADPFEQAIEIFNISTKPVDLSNWLLSDDGADLEKYKIPFGTIIPAGGFKVFYESQFGGSAAIKPFHLSSVRGGSVHLAAVDPVGKSTGWQEVAKFESMEQGTSAGRNPLTGDGSQFIAMASRTFGVDQPISIDAFRSGGGASNAAPSIGPLVINEIMYHPVNASGDENADEEFIEIYNISGGSVLLFDPGLTENRWEIRGDIQFKPASTFLVRPVEYLLIVGFNPDANPEKISAFREKYNVPSEVRIFGPFSGRLSNERGPVELYRPGRPAISGSDAGILPYYLVDRIGYASTLPWPSAANGSGSSLQRQQKERFGNDAANWRGLPPTAGRANTIAPAEEPKSDSDGDGLPDAWELAVGLNPNSAADADEDSDGDAHTNIEEFIAGTNPRDPKSRLKFESITADPSGVLISFTAAADKSYSVQAASDPASGVWQTLENIEPQTTTRMVEVGDTISRNNSKRFYRIVTPKQ